jgi:putative FmdB family regulatory protein
MPVYPYKCTTCPHHFDVAKSVRQIDDPETCPKCQSDSKRYLVAVNFNGASDWDKAEYNPGLGCIVKNTKHRERIAKARGLIELGNEDVSKYITRQEQKVAAEQDANTEAALEPVVHGMKKILRGEKIE